MSISVVSRPISGDYIYIASENPINYKFNWSCDLGEKKIYHIIIEVLEVATNKLLGKLKVKPDMSKAIISGGTIAGYEGTFNLDVSQIVKTYLDGEYINSGAVNNKNTKSSLFFYITYREMAGESGATPLSEEAFPVSVVQSARQFKDGTNLLSEFTPTGTNEAKFLTKFKEPTRYVGYPFSISFIYANALSGTQLIKVEQELDINRTQISNTETQLVTNQRNGVNNLKLKNTFASNASYDRLFLKIGTAVTDGYVDAGYVDIGYTV